MYQYWGSMVATVQYCRTVRCKDYDIAQCKIPGAVGVGVAVSMGVVVGVAV